jgi:hypothetical protein
MTFDLSTALNSLQQMFLGFSQRLPCMFVGFVTFLLFIFVGKGLRRLIRSRSIAQAILMLAKRTSNQGNQLHPRMRSRNGGDKQ